MPAPSCEHPCGISTDGRLFYTSSGNCGLPECLKFSSPKRLARFDSNWNLINELPVDYDSGIRHVGDIQVAGDRIWAPISDYATSLPGDLDLLHIAWFDSVTLQYLGHVDVLDWDTLYGIGNGDLAGVTVLDNSLYVVEWQSAGSDTTPRIFKVPLGANGDPDTLLTFPYEIETRLANGIVAFGDYLYVSAGSGVSCPCAGQLDVYDATQLDPTQVNEPIASYTFTAPYVHPEGLTFFGSELWVAQSSDVLQLQSPALPDTPCEHLVPRPILYVDDSASGRGDGSNWADAITDLAEALCVAARFPQHVEQIWVARGTYRPGDPGDRQATFLMPPNVDLYGGFSGTESSPAERDWIANPTILSGDLSGDDTPGFGHRSDNVFTVVTYDAVPGDVRLDGFMITGGNGVEGAGIRMVTSGPTIANCRIFGNQATDFGGGMSCEGSFANLFNCTFTGNDAFVGGALSCRAKGATSIVNCAFARNTGDLCGGVRVDGSVVNITNSVLWSNENPQIVDNGAPPGVTYSLVQGGWPGEGNVDADPLFADATGLDAVAGTGDDDLRLLPRSPCINAGTGAALPAGSLTDLDGNARVAGVAVDMGAFEFFGCGGADFDATGNIGIIDFLHLLASWGVCPGCPEDLDGDGAVGLSDFDTLLLDWGPCIHACCFLDEHCAEVVDVVRHCLARGGFDGGAGSDCATSACGPGYDIIDLGTLGGQTVPWDVNDAGDVVGSSEVSPGIVHAFRWSGGVLLDLGTLGAQQSEALGINDDGTIVGSVFGGGPQRPFVWANGQMTELVTNEGNGAATAINNAGQISGSADGSAVRWDQGVPVALSGPFGLLTSSAEALNDAGVAVGWSDNGFPFFDVFPVRWAMQDPEFLPGQVTFGMLPTFGINSHGAIVYGGTSAGPGRRLNIDGTMDELLITYPRDINDAGIIAGEVPGAAVVLQGAAGVDLNSLIPPGSGWVLLEATAVNNAGQIVGYGTFNGGIRGFRLDPWIGAPDRPIAEKQGKGRRLSRPAAAR